MAQNEQSSFQSLVHLGQGVHIQAEVPETAFIFVKIGLGFLAQCTLQEALVLAQSKEAELQQRLDQHNHQLSKLKAHMTLMGLGLKALNSS